MTTLHPNMVPAEGQVVKMAVVFDTATFNTHQTNSRPWIGGGLDPKKARVLAEDIVFSPRTGRGLSRSSRASAFGDLRGFSVINNSGTEGDTKFDFLRDFWIAGIAAYDMEPYALNTDTGIYSTINLQGMTYLRNNGDDQIAAGDPIMGELPENTEDAKRREMARGPPEGGTPTNRFTAFPKVYRTTEAVKLIRSDWNTQLRNPAAGRGRQPSYFPSTDLAVRYLRRCMLAGAALAQYGPGNDPTAMIEAIRDMAADHNQNAWYENVVDGDYDAHIAALLFPGDMERVVPGARPQNDDTRVTRLFHSLQRAGFDDLLSVTRRAFHEAGENRILGRALAPAKPGDQLHILLRGY